MSHESADRRLERLLVLVPWVSTQEGPTVEEVCERFAMSETELAADLEMLFLCGLYPFTPDALIEADVVDGRVWIRYADAFDRPPTFTAEEGVSLVAAASAVLELPGSEDNSALRSALSKLARALGIDDDEVVAVELAAAEPELLAVVGPATEQHLAFRAEYYSYGRDAWSTRLIEPHRLVNRGGQWYVLGRSVEIDELRTFRLDRMRSVEITAHEFVPPAEPTPDDLFRPRPNDRIVTLDLGPEADWVATQYPTERVGARPDGEPGQRVSLRISEQAWLDRLLLRLADHAKVAEGEADVRQAAARILRRYQLTEEVYVDNAGAHA